MSQALWRTALIERFAVPPLALTSLEDPVEEELKRAVQQYLKHISHDTKNAVIHVLYDNGISSSLVQLESFRIKHMRFKANEESNKLAADLQAEETEEQRQCQLALSVLHNKFGLPVASQVDAHKKTVGIGKDYILRYSVKDNDVTWELIDRLIKHPVTIDSGDPPERLGSAMQELHEKRMEWERKLLPDPKKVPPAGQGSASSDQDSDGVTDTPSDDDSGQEKA